MHQSGTEEEAEAGGVDLDELAEQHAEAVSRYVAGRYKDAASLFERTLTRCRADLGAEHPVTLTVAGNLAVSAVAGGHRRRGLAMLMDNVADRDRVFGGEDPRTLTARDALATAYRLSGDVDEAVSLAANVTAMRRRVLGPAHPDTLTSRMGLALAEAAAGDMTAALTVLTAAINDAEHAYGTQHPRVVALHECGHTIGLTPA